MITAVTVAKVDADGEAKTNYRCIPGGFGSWICPLCNRALSAAAIDVGQHCHSCGAVVTNVERSGGLRFEGSFT